MVKKFERLEKAWLPASICLLPLPFSTVSIRPTIQLPPNSINQEEQNGLGSHAGLHHRHRRSRASGEERISGCGEPMSKKSMRAVSVFAFQVIDFLVYLFVVFNQLTRRRLTTISYLLVISEKRQKRRAGIH